MQFFMMLWGIAWVRRIALYAGLVFAVIAVALLIFLKGKAAERAAAAAASMARTLEQERRMRDASARSPSDPAGVAGRMRDGTF